LSNSADRAPKPLMQCIPAVIASTVAGTSWAPTHVERLQSLETPTLIIHGTGDLAIGFDGGEKLAELIPRARLVALEGMGHFPLDPSRWTVMAEAIAEHSFKG
jgi:pimeloyl-ACP methyl ester carboxylesterase